MKAFLRNKSKPYNKSSRDNTHKAEAGIAKTSGILVNYFVFWQMAPDEDYLFKSQLGLPRGAREMSLS